MATRRRQQQATEQRERWAFVYKRMLVKCGVDPDDPRWAEQEAAMWRQYGRVPVEVLEDALDRVVKLMAANEYSHRTPTWPQMDRAIAEAAAAHEAATRPPTGDGLKPEPSCETWWCSGGLLTIRQPGPGVRVKMHACGCTLGTLKARHRVLKVAPKSVLDARAEQVKREMTATQSSRRIPKGALLAAVRAANEGQARGLSENEIAERVEAALCGKEAKKDD